MCNFQVTEQDMKLMAENNIFATLLPTTAYVLRIDPPPARKLIEMNVPVALGSDFNPNAHCLSMPAVMNLACVNMKLTMNEALVAATINSAGTMIPDLNFYSVWIIGIKLSSSFVLT
jgi:imidazolonepropionase